MLHALSCFCLSALMLAAPGEVALRLDSIEGIRPTYRTDTPRILETVTGENAVTEGAGAVRFGGHAPTADGNKYLGILASFPAPVALR
ncbi:MAG: hypothetical protein U9Q79_06860, partial [Candidatus Hydrogenedentes bacterium]|nr:hypothetical protein [Candidatus Hydrogenedentota bacterium]